jgi:DNA invertase Pin-like site-specific DNA recombinase
MGWVMVRPATTYVDDGFTAKAGFLEKREALQRLLNDATSGLFDVVMVVDLDRLTRAEDLIERASIMGPLQRARVDIYVKKSGQRLDLNSDNGDLHVGLGTYFAAQENRTRRERTIRGKINAAMNGRKPAGPTPYGYSYDKSLKEPWGHHPERAEAVREIYRQILAFVSCYRVALDLEERGFPRTRGGAWQRERVWSIVTNPLYRGEYLVDKKRGLVVKVPAIVTDEVWFAAQEALKQRRSYPVPRRRHVNLCERIAFCGTCGERMGISGNTKLVRYYVCRLKRQKGLSADRCSNRMQQVHDVDNRVWEATRKVLERPDLLAAAVKTKAESAASSVQGVAHEMVDWRRRLERLERAEAEVLIQFQRGQVSQGALNRALDSARRDQSIYQRNLAVAEQQLATARQVDKDSVTLAALVTRLRRRLETTSSLERQELIRLLVPGRDGYHITIGPGLNIEIAGLLRERSETVFSTFGSL